MLPKASGSVRGGSLRKGVWMETESKITIIKQGERLLYISIDLSLARLLAKLGLLDDVINLAHIPKQPALGRFGGTYEVY